jgi:hypothetical protein
VLSYLLGRQLRTSELVSALGVSRSAYYVAKDTGRLSRPGNLLRLASAFGVNPVELLVRYGFLTNDDVMQYVADNGLSGSEPRGEPAPSRLPRPPRLEFRPDAPPL